MSGDTNASSSREEAAVAVDRAHDERIVSRRSIRHIVRAALTAIGVRLLIGVLKSIARHKVSKRTLLAIRDELLGSDPFKWAAVFAGWACFGPLAHAVERVLMPLLAGSVGRTNVAHAAAAVSGAVVAQPIRVMQMTTRVELGLYLASRASHSVAQTFLLPRLPDLLQRFNHWDVFFVGLSGAQILYALLFCHKTHSPGYLTFLQNCVMIPRQMWDSVAAYHRGQMTPSVLQYFEAQKVTPVPTDTSNMRDILRLLHPHTEHSDLHVVQWLASHMVRFSLPLYFPLKVITTLGFGWKRVLRDPVGQAWKIVTSVIKSSLFLSLYCGGPMRVVCGFSQLNVRNPPLMGMTAGLACALPTLLEPKGRRLDLALYCNMHAFRSFVLMLAQRGFIAPPRGRHVMAMYTAAVTVLLFFLRFRPTDLHPNLRSGFGFLCGDVAFSEKDHHLGRSGHGKKHH